MTRYGVYVPSVLIRRTAPAYGMPISEPINEVLSKATPGYYAAPQVSQNAQLAYLFDLLAYHRPPPQGRREA